jgi:chaperone required for assembly of F1-ATPase
MTTRPKRFYRTVTVDGAAPAFRVLLDGRPIRTPAKRELAVPSKALAEAVAAEWEAQGERIDPASMPLTRLVNSAIDGVTGREAEVRADIAKYGASDLLCYRAEGPAELVRRQAEAAAAAMQRALAEPDAFSLAAHHVMTTLTGSALLALAHARGRLSAEQAWSAAHVDEGWQTSQWGEDAEAKARRDRRWAEMQAASRLLALLAAD